MANAEDFDGVAMIVETEAIVAEAETVFRGLDVLEPFHVAFFLKDKAREPVQEIDRGFAVDGANVGLGPVGPSIF